MPDGPILAMGLLISRSVCPHQSMACRQKLSTSCSWDILVAPSSTQSIMRPQYQIPQSLHGLDNRMLTAQGEGHSSPLRGPGCALWQDATGSCSMRIEDTCMHLYFFPVFLSRIHIWMSVDVICDVNGHISCGTGDVQYKCATCDHSEHDIYMHRMTSFPNRYTWYTNQWTTEPLHFPVPNAPGKHSGAIQVQRCCNTYGSSFLFQPHGYNGPQKQDGLSQEWTRKLQ